MRWARCRRSESSPCRANSSNIATDERRSALHMVAVCVCPCDRRCARIHPVGIRFLNIDAPPHAEGLPMPAAPRCVGRCQSLRISGLDSGALKWNTSGRARVGVSQISLHMVGARTISMRGKIALPSRRVGLTKHHAQKTLTSRGPDCIPFASGSDTDHIPIHTPPPHWCDILVAVRLQSYRTSVQIRVTDARVHI